MAVYPAAQLHPGKQGAVGGLVAFPRLWWTVVRLCLGTLSGCAKSVHPKSARSSADPLPALSLWRHGLPEAGQACFCMQGATTPFLALWGCSSGLFFSLHDRVAKAESQSSASGCGEKVSRAKLTTRGGQDSETGLVEGPHTVVWGAPAGVGMVAFPRPRARWGAVLRFGVPAPTPFQGRVFGRSFQKLSGQDKPLYNRTII